MALPLPLPNQAYCNVSALEGGHLTMVDAWIINPSTPGAATKTPSLCFLLLHSNRAEKFVFDMGLRRDVENYPPPIVEELATGILPYEIPQDVVESLSRGSLAPNDIDYVAISHLHWDHIGNTGLFAQSTFIVGEECKLLLASGYPQDPNSEFASNVPPPERTRYLSTVEWKPIGPFPRGLDFYGDGSLYIIDAPGHLPGHINILARITDDGGWLFLAGDSAHHWHILTGEAKVAIGAPWDPHFCIHKDLGKAEEHIEHIKQFKELPRTQVILAHDEPWYSENQQGAAFWPGKIPPK